MTTATAQITEVTRLPRLRVVGILVIGVVLIPAALSLVMNSWGALTVDGALRMAFASVAGQTIAIGSVAAAWVLTVRRGQGAVTVVLMSVITIAVTVYALSAMAGAGTLLLERVDLLADVADLNR